MALSAAKPQLIMVDDDAIIADSLEFVLKDDYDIRRAHDRESSFQLIDSLDSSPALALIDLGLPPDTHRPDEGLAVIRKFSQQHPSTRVVVLSGQDNKKHVLQAREDGAVDFIAKPCDIAEIKMRLRRQIADTQKAANDGGGFEGIVGTSEPTDLLRIQIRQLADSPYPVLIEGESGSGKEITARNLHLCSSRKQMPFLTLNCAAFNGELLESQLFGHVKGSFTGATDTRAGFFEEAGDGTLFLDEVADLPLDLQAKLLRVLENGEYYRLGETQPRHASARVLAATNKDILAAVNQGGFREDLYHRLSVLTISVPPLRDRDGDKLELLHHYQQQVAGQMPTFQLDEESAKLWNNYNFPGNVRELRNIIIRLSAKYPGQTIKPDTLASEMTGLAQQKQSDSAWLSAAMQQQDFQLDRLLKAVEKEAIELAMRKHGGNVSKAAEMLGINRTTLYGRMDRLEDQE